MAINLANNNYGGNTNVQNGGVQPVTDNGQGGQQQQGQSQNQASSYNAPNGANQYSSGSGVQPVTTPKPQGTGYVNTSTYLNANQGNNLGQAVQSSIQNTTNQAQNAYNQGQSQFNQGYNQAQQTAQAGQNLYNQIGNLDWAGNPASAENSLIGANNAQNYGTLHDLRQGYQGPTAIGNSDQLTAQANALHQLAGSLGTPGGIQQATTQYINPQQQYNQAQQGLDTLFVNQNANNINQARLGALNAASNINSGLSQAQLQGQGLSNQWNNLNTGLNSSLNNAANSGLTNYVNSEAAAANNNPQAQAQQAQLVKDITNSTVTPQEFALLNQIVPGQNSAMGTGLDKAALLKYLSPGAGQYTGAEVATSQDLGTRNALAALMPGSQNSSSGQLLAGSTGTPSQYIAQGLDPMQLAALNQLAGSTPVSKPQFQGNTNDTLASIAGYSPGSSVIDKFTGRSMGPATGTETPEQRGYLTMPGPKSGGTGVKVRPNAFNDGT